MEEGVDEQQLLKRAVALLGSNDRRSSSLRHTHTRLVIGRRSSVLSQSILLG